jgi:hypothetical protein
MPIVPGLTAGQAKSPILDSVKPSPTDLLLAASEMHSLGKFAQPSSAPRPSRKPKAT